MKDFEILISKDLKKRFSFKSVTFLINNEKVSVAADEIDEWEFRSSLNKLLSAGLSPTIVRDGDKITFKFNSLETSPKMAESNQFFIDELKLNQPVITGNGKEG